jgi:hypothetical protein
MQIRSMPICSNSSRRSRFAKRSPCTGIEPVSPVRQTGWYASFITGHVHLGKAASAARPQALQGRESRFANSKGGRSRTLCMRVGAALLSQEHAPIEIQEPAVGLEPTWSALRGRCSACRASPANSSSQCWCRARSIEVQSLDPLPRAWLSVIGVATRRARATGTSEGGRRESNPHLPGSQPGLAAALSSATTLRPGIEPGTRPYEGRVTFHHRSDQQHQHSGQDSNLDLLLRKEP